MKTVLRALVPGYEGQPLAPYLPAHIRLALRMSVLLAVPYSLYMHWRPFSLLSASQREQVLDAMAHSSLAPVRGVVQWWKLVAWTTSCH